MMGILEMLFGKKKPQFTERIWLTEEGKINDLLSHVRDNKTKGVNSVIVTHFQDTLQILLEMLTKDSLDCHVIKSVSQFPRGVPDVFNQNGQIVVLASEAIPPLETRDVSVQSKIATLSSVSVHLIEHYPVIERDQRVLDLDKVWPMRLAFTSYTSLDEPWLSSFGVDRVRGLLPKLGMDKDEVLEYPMLIRSIQTAQKRLSRQVLREHPCASCQEWVRKNLNSRA